MTSVTESKDFSSRRYQGGYGIHILNHIEVQGEKAGHVLTSSAFWVDRTCFLGGLLGASSMAFHRLRIWECVLLGIIVRQDCG